MRRLMPTDDQLRTFYVDVFPREYIGAVHVALRSDGLARDVQVDFKWGAWRHAVMVEIVDSEGIGLVFAKTNDDAVPLRVFTSVPVCIVADQGMPTLPGARVMDCNEGWEA